MGRGGVGESNRLGHAGPDKLMSSRKGPAWTGESLNSLPEPWAERNARGLRIPDVCYQLKKIMTVKYVSKFVSWGILCHCNLART